MDIGDIIRLIFFGVIFLSFFGGLFGKKSGNEQKPRRASRPQDIFQSGGAPPTPEPVAMEVYTGEGTSRTEERRAELRERFGDKLERRQPLEQDVTEGDVVEAVTATRQPRAAEVRGRHIHRRDEFLEQDVRMDLTPEHPRAPLRQRATVARRHHPATGGAVLRRSLRDPDTLERAFIIKEVLDKPVGMRQER